MDASMSITDVNFNPHSECFFCGVLCERGELKESFTNKVTAFKMLMRHLKVDIVKLCNSLDSKVEDIVGAYCLKCDIILDEFWEWYQYFEGTRLQLNKSLRNLCGVIETANSGGDRGVDGGAILEVIRKKTLEKYYHQISRATPRVEIKKIGNEKYIYNDNQSSSHDLPHSRTINELAVIETSNGSPSEVNIPEMSTKSRDENYLKLVQSENKLELNPNASRTFWLKLNQIREQLIDIKGHFPLTLFENKKYFTRDYRSTSSDIPHSRIINDLAVIETSNDNSLKLAQSENKLEELNPKLNSSRRLSSKLHNIREQLIDIKCHIPLTLFEKYSRTFSNQRVEHLLTQMKVKYAKQKPKIAKKPKTNKVHRNSGGEGGEASMEVIAMKTFQKYSRKYSRSTSRVAFNKTNCKSISGIKDSPVTPQIEAEPISSSEVINLKNHIPLTSKAKKTVTFNISETATFKDNPKPCQARVNRIFIT